MMTNTDRVSAVVTGVTAGFIAWRVLAFLGKTDVVGVSLAWLVLVVPVLWFVGVWFGYFLGRRFPFFKQFGKFVAIGFTNSAVDFGVLYVLIAASGVAKGSLFPVFKSISFLVAMLHSYFWNKRWAFEAGKNNGGAREFFRFFGVSLVSLLVNVTVASLIVNSIGGPLFGLNDNAWAGVGAAAGAAAGLVFSFIGFKLVVFKKYAG